MSNRLLKPISEISDDDFNVYKKIINILTLGEYTGNISLEMGESNVKTLLESLDRFEELFINNTLLFKVTKKPIT